MYIRHAGEANLRHGAEPPEARVADQQYPGRSQGQVGPGGLGGGRPLGDAEQRRQERHHRISITTLCGKFSYHSSEVHNLCHKLS